MRAKKTLPLDGQVLITVSKDTTVHLFATQDAQAAVTMARTMRADGWDAKIAVWNGTAYSPMHA